MQLQQIEELARDLAEGALDHKWDSLFILQEKNENLVAYITTKWSQFSYKNDYKPLFNLLASFGYCLPNHTEPIEEYSSVHGGLPITKTRRIDRYILTSKAFALLEKPAKPATVFLSYKRDCSSLLALLVQARIKLQGAEAFLDVTNIDLGAEWHPLLEERIKNTRFFVCFVAPNTFASPNVCQEITWAIASDAIILPIYHDGFAGTGEIVMKAVEKFPALEKFLKKNASIINNTSDPNEINSKINQLLNTLGYSVL